MLPVRYLPKTPQISWLNYSRNIRLRLSGESVKNVDEFPRALGLLAWDEVQVDGSNVLEIVQRKLDGWIVVGFNNLNVWSDLIGNKFVELSSDTTSWMNVLEQNLDSTAERFLWVVSADGCADALQFLHDHPAVRDYTGAVVLIEPKIEESWLEKHFNHTAMDVEANIALPYFVLSSQPETYMQMPTEDEQGWKSIDVIPILSIDEVDLEEVSLDVASWMATMVTIMICKRKESS